jgi:branched-chain amino acid transport system permease protein
MLAVREDEIAAASLGISPARSKVMAFVFGAFFAGTAGAALAQYEGYITPANFDFMRSVELVVVVTLAGAGSITGTILLAIILRVLPETLDVFDEYRMIIYSLILIVTMLARPAGILGNRELIPRRKLEVEKAPA